MHEKKGQQSSPRPVGLGRLADLPEELKFLAEPAARYRFECEAQVLRFLDHATDDEIEELAALAERVRLERLYPKVLRLLDNELYDTWEGMWLYLLFGAMDYADLNFHDLYGNDRDIEELFGCSVEEYNRRVHFCYIGPPESGPLDIGVRLRCYKYFIAFRKCPPAVIVDSFIHDLRNTLESRGFIVGAQYTTLTADVQVYDTSENEMGAKVIEEVIDSIIRRYNCVERWRPLNSEKWNVP